MSVTNTGLDGHTNWEQKIWQSRLKLEVWLELAPSTTPLLAVEQPSVTSKSSKEFKLMTNSTYCCGAFGATRTGPEAVITPDNSNVDSNSSRDCRCSNSVSWWCWTNRKTLELYGLSWKTRLSSVWARMFGVIDFENGTSDYGYSIGFRNSHDKTWLRGSARERCDGVR